MSNKWLVKIPTCIRKKARWAASWPNCAHCACTAMQWTGGYVHRIRIELSQRWCAVIQSQSLARRWWTRCRLSILIDWQTWSWCIRFLSENTLPCIRITHSFSYTIWNASVMSRRSICVSFKSTTKKMVLCQIKWHFEWTSMFVTNSWMAFRGLCFFHFLCTLASGYMHTISIMMVQVQLKMNQLAELSMKLTNKIKEFTCITRPHIVAIANRKLVLKKRSMCFCVCTRASS